MTTKTKTHTWDRDDTTVWGKPLERHTATIEGTFWILERLADRENWTLKRWSEQIGEVWHDHFPDGTAWEMQKWAEAIATGQPCPGFLRERLAG